MRQVRWEFYPLVAQNETARSWLQMQTYLQLAPTTIDAYGRGLNDYLDFCTKQHILPEDATREDVALYVQDLASRPNRKGANILTFDSGRGLSHATMQQRLTVARLYHDYLVEKQLRADNPVGRGQYVPGNALASQRERAILRSHHKLPWIPSDEEWQAVLRVLKDEPLRNQVMLLLAYDGALRRQELVTIEIADLDFAYRQIRIRAEHAKNGTERVVGYSTVTSCLLERYLARRRALSLKRGALFLSESRRNPAQPLSLIMWSKIVQRLAQRADLPRFTTHTPRHLRLTYLARAQMDLHQIALYAGHRSLETTMLYIHLSGVDLTAAVTRSLAGFEQWIARILKEADQ
jgi:integrase/recombinase XerD